MEGQPLMLTDVLLVDKPSGITSFDVIRRLRKKLGITKMGHAGTLDPLASGLLIIGVGSGTKKLHALAGLSKVYEAEILLGTKTDTGDVTGKVVMSIPVKEHSPGEIKKALHSLVGTVTLAVPLYSAVKQKGKPLYRYAREGKSVTVPMSEMEVHEAMLLSIEGAILKVRFDVGSGTYIRSLAEELGERLGIVATLKNLRRVSIGKYKVDDARKV